MFKKSERLSRSEFTHFFGVGTKKHFKHLTIITFPSPSLKVSVVVGKKVAKSAVKRNGIKRRVYAILRKRIGAYQGVLIVVAKPSLSTLPRKVAETEISEVIAQVLKSA
jgi:ribonuclease P protein component